MINMKGDKKENKSILYIFVILFFGWIISELISLNPNYLKISQNEITGLQFYDPFGSLGNTLSSTTLFGGTSVLSFLIAFLIIFSIIFIASSNIKFFEGNEKRGALITFSIAVSLITALYTPIVSWILGFAAYLGFFLPILIFVIIAIIAYLYFHRTIRQDIRQTFPRNENEPGFVERYFGGVQQRDREEPQQEERQRRQRNQQQNQGIRAQDRQNLENNLNNLIQIYRRGRNEVNKQNPRLNRILNDLEDLNDIIDQIILNVERINIPGNQNLALINNRCTRLNQDVENLITIIRRILQVRAPINAQQSNQIRNDYENLHNNLNDLRNLIRRL